MAIGVERIIGLTARLPGIERITSPLQFIEIDDSRVLIAS
jgi:hypothetical protein